MAAPLSDSSTSDVAAGLGALTGDRGKLPIRERLQALVVRLRPHRTPLRRRILLTFTFGSLALSAFLAAATYSFTKSALLKQSEDAAIQRAFENVNIVDSELPSSPPPAQLIAKLQGGEQSNAVLVLDDSTANSSVDFQRPDVPTRLAERVIEERGKGVMIAVIRNEPVLVVGLPVPSFQASYFEFTRLSDLQDTLASVGRSLIAAAVVTTGLGVLLGSLAARRSVRPLGDAAQAAKAIAGGRLDTRLEPNDDPDLHLLVTSFNDMAEALQTRVERDARFASDVSHELRSPLMTLSATAEVLVARREDMPERAQSALDLLVADVGRFQGLVEDLLEISRFDAGAIRLHNEELLVAEFVRQAIAVSSLPDAELTVSERGELLVINGDKRRLARVIANLLDNARFYGGAEGVTVQVSEALGESEPISHAWIAVEDHGPGVPFEERSLVFERFARGGSAGRRAANEGAGLGLALVDEHVRMHGGRVWVEDRLDEQPGARFIIELPAEEA
jgi:two-component system, OmpR family, sensor histidine kinase MtrB